MLTGLETQPTNITKIPKIPKSKLEKSTEMIVDLLNKILDEKVYLHIDLDCYDEIIKIISGIDNIWNKEFKNRFNKIKDF